LTVFDEPALVQSDPDVLLRQLGEIADDDPPTSSNEQKKKKPTLDEFLDKRDWTGLLTLMEFERNSQNEEYDLETLVMWMAYAAFHLGDYKKAANVGVRELPSNNKLPAVAVGDEAG
jgi:hypothetical protein